MKKSTGVEKKTNGKYPVHARFGGRVLIVGFGSIGQGVLPLIVRHLGVEKKDIRIITADLLGRDVARAEGVSFRIEPLTKENYLTVLDKYLREGDFLVNLSVDVASLDLVHYCQAHNIFYVDTCIEPWKGGYTDMSLSVTQRSNYGLREDVLAAKEAARGKKTAVVAHGANPGIVSHFVKAALLHIARDTGLSIPKPSSRKDWAKLMQKLRVKSVHIAEYDSQKSRNSKKIGRFENTWSVNGFHSEGICQPTEMGWGTHEKHWPRNAHRHPYGCDAAVYLDQPGGRTLVRTWTPEHGHFLGRAVTHNESISIADYFTVRGAQAVVYRPTVHYAYRSCDASILSLEECLGNGSKLQEEQYILMDDIESGMDELGVLLMGHKKGAYWYGSQLTIQEARKLAPYQNATGLQVTAGVLGAMVWAIENPNSGIVEADEIDHERVMEVIDPYMGKMTGAYTDWTPLKDRDTEFSSECDASDPWQFKNIIFEGASDMSRLSPEQPTRKRAVVGKGKKDTRSV